MAKAGPEERPVWTGQWVDRPVFLFLFLWGCSQLTGVPSSCSYCWTVHCVVGVTGKTHPNQTAFHSVLTSPSLSVITYGLLDRCRNTYSPQTEGRPTPADSQRWQKCGPLPEILENQIMEKTKNNRERPTSLGGAWFGAERLLWVWALPDVADTGGLSTRKLTILPAGNGLHLLSTFHVPGGT